MQPRCWCILLPTLSDPDLRASLFASALTMWLIVAAQPFLASWATFRIVVEGWTRILSTSCRLEVWPVDSSCVNLLYSIRRLDDSATWTISERHFGLIDLPVLPPWRSVHTPVIAWRMPVIFETVDTTRSSSYSMAATSRSSRERAAGEMIRS